MIFLKKCHASILLLRINDDKSRIDLPAGSIVFLIENSGQTTFITSNGRIVKIRNISMTEVASGDLSHVADSTKKLKIYANGLKHWFKNDRLHRDDGPAVEWPDGTRKWFQNGQYHRDDGPAIEWSDGSRWWFKSGQRLCVDEPAIEWAVGSKWWLNG